MKRALRALAVFAACALASAQAFGQGAADYPSRGISLVMALAAGSAGDVLGRIVANKMSQELGRPIVSENVTGAGGQIGIERVNRASPDGYTILGAGDNQLIYVPLFTKGTKFDPRNDFTPITQLALVDYALVAHPSLGAKSVPELIALAKAQPGKINYSSAGVGSTQHIAMEYLMAKTGAKLTHVPYRGATPALNDVVSGVVSVMFTAVSVAAPFLQDGTLRILATAGLKRSTLMPEVPTVAEAVDGFEFRTWMALLAPAKTPPEIVARLHAAAAAAINDPAIRPQLAASGFTPVGNSPEELRLILARDYERVAEIMRSAGIAPN
jgi:tripartite-type tricarboxylate transporter receptor subunit TctC